MNIHQIKFPPVGGIRQFLVTCDGHPFASFDTQAEAQAAKEMYATPVKLAKGTALSSNATKDWKVVPNPSFKG